MDEAEAGRSLRDPPAVSPVDCDRAHRACVAEAFCAVLVELVDQEVG